MRHSRNTFTVYPPNYEPGDGYRKTTSVLQAKKIALKWGTGSQVWRNTGRRGRSDDRFLAFTWSTDFEFEVL